MEKNLLDFLKVNEVEYKENIEAKSFSPIKIGGTVRIVIYPDSEIKMISALNFLEKNEISYRVIGKASNILFPDSVTNTVIVKTDRLRGIKISDGTVCLASGESLSANAQKFASMGIGGISQLCGIPGSVGGLVRNNAGAFGKEICGLVKSVLAYAPEERKAVRLENKDFTFGYRDSIFKMRDFTILKVELALPFDLSPDKIIDEIKLYKNLRRQTQPAGQPSLGSVFKRPEGDFAARLIDVSGLKGTSIGGAEVSRKHAGFIVNNGDAIAEDFRSLSAFVKRTVLERQGVELEEEIEFL